MNIPLRHIIYIFDPIPNRVKQRLFWKLRFYYTNEINIIYFGNCFFFPKIMHWPLYLLFTLFFANIILDPFKIMWDSCINSRLIIISTSISSTNQPNEECSFSYCPIFFSDFLVLTAANNRNQNSWNSFLLGLQQKWKGHKKRGPIHWMAAPF